MIWLAAARRLALEPGLRLAYGDPCRPCVSTSRQSVVGSMRRCDQHPVCGTNPPSRLAAPWRKS
jgi:hypothetical protein